MRLYYFFEYIYCFFMIFENYCGGYGEEGNEVGGWVEFGFCMFN